MSLHEPSLDPRTRRTLALLERAMGTLLETLSISEINVSELCRVAGIHRTTFYKHFSSVAEFAAYMYSRLIDDLGEISEEDLPATADEVPEHYRRAFVRMLDHIAEQRPVYARLFASGGDHHFQRILADVLTERAKEANRRLVERGREIDVDEETAARMVGAACAGAMGVWAQQETTDSERRAHEVMGALPPWWHVR